MKTRSISDGGNVVALCGGIGGAKLAFGLARKLPPGNLTIVVNTGDDFRHFGLHVSPDIDTVIYTLSGRANTEFGWGRENDRWCFMEAMRELGGPDWFNLGDADLATKAYRTERLANGARLTTVTDEIAKALGVKCRIIPATDDPVPTMVETTEGDMPFQHYFVRRRWQPKVTAIRLDNARAARPTDEILQVLGDERLSTVILCPSNPYLSLDPILSIPGIKEALRSSPATVAAVAPLIGGAAVKGPLSKMMGELGLEISLQTIADHYGDLLDLFIADNTDKQASVTGPAIVYANTLMTSTEDKTSLAEEVINLVSDYQGHGR